MGYSYASHRQKSQTFLLFSSIFSPNPAKGLAHGGLWGVWFFVMEAQQRPPSRQGRKATKLPRIPKALRDAMKGKITAGISQATEYDYHRYARKLIWDSLNPEGLIEEVFAEELSNTLHALRALAFQGRKRTNRPSNSQANQSNASPYSGLLSPDAISKLEAKRPTGDNGRPGIGQISTADHTESVSKRLALASKLRAHLMSLLSDLRKLQADRG